MNPTLAAACWNTEYDEYWSFRSWLRSMTGSKSHGYIDVRLFNLRASRHSEVTLDRDSRTRAHFWRPRTQTLRFPFSMGIVPHLLANPSFSHTRFFRLFFIRPCRSGPRVRDAQNKHAFTANTGSLSQIREARTHRVNRQQLTGPQQALLVSRPSNL